MGSIQEPFFVQKLLQRDILYNIQYYCEERREIKSFACDSLFFVTIYLYKSEKKYTQQNITYKMLENGS
jgi:hypothetical protein